MEAGAQVLTEQRPGKGNAVRRLFDAAEADVYVLVDGDHTYDAKSVHRLVECLVAERLDMVIARRATNGADDGAAYRKGHQLGNRAFAFTISKLFGYRLDDVFSGYRAFSRRFVKSFPALSSGFEIETELTVFALDLGLPIREIAVPYRSRPAGSASKLRTYRDGARIAMMLAYLFEQARPAAFFGALSGLCTVTALILGVPVVFEFLETGLVPRLPTAVLSAALMIVAAVFGVCGIVLDSVGRGRKEARRLAYIAAS
jgi:glycosyltransferase involved in cell wall biosynthesis